LLILAGLDLYLLGHLATCINPVALKGTKDGPEAALLCFEAALQGVNHLSMDRRIFEML
jgi:hypothetical protein